AWTESLGDGRKSKKSGRALFVSGPAGRSRAADAALADDRRKSIWEVPLSIRPDTRGARHGPLAARPQRRGGKVPAGVSEGSRAAVGCRQSRVRALSKHSGGHLCRTETLRGSSPVASTLVGDPGGELGARSRRRQCHPLEPC